MVIDADGLNALIGHLKVLPTTHNPQPTLIMTPHPGEMARLTGLSVKIIQGDRKYIAKRFSGIHKVTLVLKGHNTVVADKGEKIYVNKTGNPGMATAGSGDVLTGILAAFLAQGLKAFEAARQAVFLHGLAGDIAGKEKTELSLIASDIIEKIPDAIKKAG